MEINSVGLTNGAVQQQLETPRQPRQEIAERPRENTDASRSSEAQTAASQQAPVRRAERPVQAERPEQPKPVVNAQGQKTGTIINTTA